MLEVPSEANGFARERLRCGVVLKRGLGIDLRQAPELKDRGGAE